MEEPGGILTYGIPPYRLQKDVVKRQIQAIESTGVQIKLKVNVGKDVTLEDLQRDFDAVFCATGAWEQASLGIKDEELLTSGLEFLTQVKELYPEAALTVVAQARTAQLFKNHPAVSEVIEIAPGSSPYTRG